MTDEPNGQASAAPQDAPSAPSGAPPARRKRWGPIPEGGAVQTEPKRKRKSRWEASDDTSSSTALTVVTSGGNTVVRHIPKEIVLSGGIAVAMPSVLTGRQTHSDPAIQKMYDDLEDLSNRIDANDIRLPPEHARSPSPEPVYDRNGVRQNTREVRMREKMIEQRERMVEELIKVDPTYKPPAEFRPAKRQRKLYIPYREYPGYNFIGLLIGPRGNTQKRMQKETNTRIVIRGKGIVKDQVYDYGEDDDLHVLIQGDTEEDVDNAVQLVKDLLTPVDENGGVCLTLCIHDVDRRHWCILIICVYILMHLCHAHTYWRTHTRVDCYRLHYDTDDTRLPMSKSGWRCGSWALSLAPSPPTPTATCAAALGTTAQPVPTRARPTSSSCLNTSRTRYCEVVHVVLCCHCVYHSRKCIIPAASSRECTDHASSPTPQVEAQYARDVARMNPGEAGGPDAEYTTFLQELGGGAIPEGIKINRAGLGLHRNSRDLPDNCKLYVGNLPNHFDDTRLAELFEQFGPLVHCMVMKVRVATGTDL